MKAISLLIVICALSGVLLQSGCKKHHSKTVADQQLDKLNFNWQSTSVTLDNVSKDTYGDFTISLHGAQGSKSISYTTEGRPSLSPWPQAGTLTFDNVDPSTKLLRDDLVAITYAVTGNTLSIKFFFSEPGYLSRTGSVKGAWDFEFEKK